MADFLLVFPTTQRWHVEEILGSKLRAFWTNEKRKVKPKSKSKWSGFPSFETDYLSKKRTMRRCKFPRRGLNDKQILLRPESYLGFFAISFGNEKQN